MKRLADAASRAGLRQRHRDRLDRIRSRYSRRRRRCRLTSSSANAGRRLRPRRPGRLRPTRRTSSRLLRDVVACPACCHERRWCGPGLVDRPRRSFGHRRALATALSSQAMASFSREQSLDGHETALGTSAGSVGVIDLLPLDAWHTIGGFASSRSNACCRIARRSASGVVAPKRRFVSGR